DKPHTMTTRARHLVALSIAEIRRLFNLIDKDDHVIDQGLRASAWRRGHQADARRSHFRRRLRLQMLEI
ncbi:hypothetical protein QMK34_08395, partial [Amycolatopsis sp. H20-H5]